MYVLWCIMVQSQKRRKRRDVTKYAVIWVGKLDKVTAECQGTEVRAA